MKNYKENKSYNIFIIIAYLKKKINPTESIKINFQNIKYLTLNPEALLKNQFSFFNGQLYIL